MTTIEMHQIVTVRRTAGASRAWCPVCLQEVEMVPLAEAALLLGVSLRDTCRRVGDDSFHFVETPVRLLAALLLIRQVSAATSFL